MLTQTETVIVAVLGLWQILVPLVYTLRFEKNSRMTSRLFYVLASLALSLLAMIFLYTLFARLGLINALAALDANYANAFIMLMVFVCPLLIATGYYRLQKYNTRPHD